MKTTIIGICLFLFSGLLAESGSTKPLMREFMGINGHFKFKPELYSKVCRLARNYHNVNWDVKHIGDPITLPICANKVHWIDHVYGKWAKQGFENDICVQFSGFSYKDVNYLDVWRGKDDWLYQYGKNLAQTFGPSFSNLASSIEIGNEPGQKFDDQLYQNIYRQMAKGIRAGDPKIKIVTATVQAENPDDYSKDVRTSFSDSKLLQLVDVFNVHTYAAIPRKNNQESPWNRTYPEDPSVPYLKVVDDMIAWRDQKSKGKEIWVTEFGYDSVTPEAMKLRKDWTLKLDWQGFDDLRQAQYIVRSFLALASRNVDRAYLFYYDDDNVPGVHSGSGLTRKFVPKPSFYAMQQMYQLLGDYRFDRIVEQVKGDRSIYAFKNDVQKEIWVLWSPTGTQTHKKDDYRERTMDIVLKKLLKLPVKALAMATEDKLPEEVTFEKLSGNSVKLKVGESPCYVMFE